MSFNSVIKDLETTIVNLIKKDISSKGLVDTGTLLNSITASVKIDNGNIKISVDGEDYFKYLDEEYNITNDIINSSGFSEVESKMEEAYFLFIEEEINKKSKD